MMTKRVHSPNKPRQKQITQFAKRPNQQLTPVHYPVSRGGGAALARSFAAIISPSTQSRSSNSFAPLSTDDESISHDSSATPIAQNSFVDTTAAALLNVSCETSSPLEENGNDATWSDSLHMSHPTPDHASSPTPMEATDSITCPLEENNTFSTNTAADLSQTEPTTGSPSPQIPAASSQASYVPINPYRRVSGTSSAPNQGPSTFRPRTSANGFRNNAGMSQARQQSTPGTVDKAIILKRGHSRDHIHRYTLCLKITTGCSEEEEQSLVKKEIANFFSIVLRADNKSIIPPFLDLDRNDRNTPNLSSSFSIDDLDSFADLKKYFSRISPRKDNGSVWCSLILAQSISFSLFLDKARHSLENHGFSLWPKVSDYESAAEVGWMLYSTRQQDETRLAEFFFQLSGEQIGVKWHPIRTSDGYKKKDAQDDSEKVYALHLEASSDRARSTREKLKEWYGSGKTKFPDGTKMRLVPPFNTILSTSNKGKICRFDSTTSGLILLHGSRHYMGVHNKSSP